MSEYKSENYREFRRYKSKNYLLSKVKKPKTISKERFNELYLQELLDESLDEKGL